MGKMPIAIPTQSLVILEYGYLIDEPLSWYRRPDLNQHDLRHCPLKTACLPIPPLRQYKNIHMPFTGLYNF